MAVMSTKKTGSTLSSWEYYVVGKEDWKRYEKILLVESSVPIPLYLDKMGRNISPKVFSNKTALQLLDNKNHIIGGKSHAHVKIQGIVGFLPITKLSKPPRNTTEKEDIALGQLTSEIKQRMVGNKGITIIVKSHNKVVFTFENCVGARTFKGTPKADFSIINSSGREIAFISHKDAGGAKAYQQYVSLTGKSNDGVNRHPIVQDFLRRLVMHHDFVTKQKRRIMKLVPFDKEGMDLMNYSIYGTEYGKAYSKEHVHFIGQGRPTLKEANPKDKPKNTGIAYELKFSDDLSVSGDLSHFKLPGYEPIILARFTTGRFFYIGNNKYSDIRLLIAPKALTSTAVNIDEL